jgi:hypothetical protein
MIILSGKTRIVFLFKKFVIKIPSYRYFFISGLLANFYELLTYILNKNKKSLAKIYFSLPFFFIIAKRYDSLEQLGFTNFENINIDAFCRKDYSLSNIAINNIDNVFVLVDYAPRIRLYKLSFLFLIDFIINFKNQRVHE